MVPVHCAKLHALSAIERLKATFPRDAYPHLDQLKARLDVPPEREHADLLERHEALHVRVAQLEERLERSLAKASAVAAVEQPVDDGAPQHVEDESTAAIAAYQPSSPNPEM